MGKSLLLVRARRCRSTITLFDTQLTGCISLSAAFSNARKQFVVYDGQEGFVLRDMRSGGFLRKFLTNPRRPRLPKQVAFGEDDCVVVGGGDMGSVYIFDKRTGANIDTLKHLHSDRGLIQTLTVCIFLSTGILRYSSPADSQ